MLDLRIEKIRENMFEALKKDPTMILTFRSKLVTDEMWEYALAMYPELFKYCKRRTYRVVSFALSMDGMFLGDLDPTDYTLDQFTKLTEIAVVQNPKAVALVPKEFLNNRLLGYAYAKDPELLLSEKKLTPNMVISIIDHNPSLIRYVVDPTDDMIIHALSKDPRVIVYFTSISDRVRDYFEETYPQYASMIIHS